MDATVPDDDRGRIDEGAGPREARTLSATCALHARRHVRRPRAPSAPRPPAEGGTTLAAVAGHDVLHRLELHTAHGWGPYSLYAAERMNFLHKKLP